jgi:uncharacterized protein YkwD
MRPSALAFALVVVLAACGGGGGGSGAPGVPPTSPATGAPSSAPSGGASATPTASANAVAGTIVQIPADAYGPIVIGSSTYVSADASQTAPLAGATVVVGPVPVMGSTPPAALPAGDVSATTTSTGAFTASVAVAPAPPSSVEPFVIPTNNITGFMPPATGYYIEVFGAGADGRSAGAPIPLHRFVAPSTALALRVSSTSSAEAAALTNVNADRAANGAGPLTFDESAEEVARLHATDESTVGYTCHYDTHNVGPSSRYLAANGIGLTGEGLGFTGATTLTAAFQLIEATFLAEKTLSPPGGHFTNLVDPAHVWAGLAGVEVVASPDFYNVDYDLVTPNGTDAVVGSSGYPTTGVCPGGTIDNNS